MSIEVVAISALIVSILGAVATCISKIGLKKCHAGCIESDCRDSDMEKELCRLQESIEKKKAKIESIKSKRGSEPTTPTILNTLETII